MFSAIAEAISNRPTQEQAFDLGAVEAAVTDRTKLVILSAPNNPTGTVCSTDDLLRFLAGDDVVVIIDEAYLEFVTDESVEIQ